MSRAGPPRVVCIGEVLWDVFGGVRRLGGAPFNVACHLRAMGLDASMVSRVGDDALGATILEEARTRGLPVELVQIDHRLPTGQVVVTLDRAGIPGYVICEPAAWDAIRATPASVEVSRSADVVVFGSLAQRREPSRSSIRTMLRTAALKVFDVNLRPPHDDRIAVEHLLHLSNMVKLNDDEIRRLAAWYGFRGAGLADWSADMARRYGLATVCVTSGAEGASLWHRGAWVQSRGHHITVADTVGAGDAFLAALLAKLLTGAPAAEALEWANAAGAYVASQEGAIPNMDAGAVEALMAS